MEVETRFVLSEKEKEVMKKVVETIKCDSECNYDRYCNCPFLMENGGCMLQAFEDILDEQERRDF